MSDLERNSKSSLSAQEATLLVELNLSKILLLNDDMKHEYWEPESMADVIYYLEREIAEIEDLLRNSAARIAKLIQEKVGDQGVVLPGDRPKLTVPAGGPSDADLLRKQSELQEKLDLIKPPTQAKAA